MTWKGMLDRCYNEDSRGYKYSGAKGIRVCARWFEFENFVADMGRRPNAMFLDRIDASDHYTSKNCRWATKKNLYNRKHTGRALRTQRIIHNLRGKSRDDNASYSDLHHVLDVC